MYQSLIQPLLFRFEPEVAHDVVQEWGKLIQALPGGVGLVKAMFPCPQYDRLGQTVWGVAFPSPVGMAAGFDKNIEWLPLLEALGFGYAEVGSISAQPVMGNPKPRLFRLPQDKALINRLGLNNLGVAELATRLKQHRRTWPVGVSIVKTHDPAIVGERSLEDFSETLKGVHGQGAYVSMNISCPNTTEGKTFEEPEALNQLLTYLRQVEAVCVKETGVAPRPWLLKISPDIDSTTQLREMFEVACQFDIQGWVVSNSTTCREGLITSSDTLAQVGAGGLTGTPLFERSTAVLGELYQISRSHPHMRCIGVGGIDSVEAAWAKITHGASLIQIYTAFVYQGPALVRQLTQGLQEKLDIHGFDTIEDAVGSAFR